MDEINETVISLSLFEKTELACTIRNKRLCDYGLVLEVLGLGDSVATLQDKADKLVHDKYLLYARLDNMPLETIRQFINKTNIIMQ